MKIFNLTKNHSTYTSNAYFVRGDWNTLQDINTLIDTGRDPVLFDTLDHIYTGVGKSRIERVLLTHNHYDHTGNLKEIIKRWNPEVYAFSKSINAETKIIRDGEYIRIGDQNAMVIACPGHSSDSVCFYVPSEKILFSGDTQLTNIPKANYPENFKKCIEKISMLNIKIIYPGHGDPISDECNKKLKESLKIVNNNNSNNIQLIKDTASTSKYCWLNIEAEDQRVGKMRMEINSNGAKIYSIAIYQKYERNGFAKHCVDILKSKYNTVIADRVRSSARGFWEKMSFVENNNGSFIWTKLEGE